MQPVRREQLNSRQRKPVAPSQDRREMSLLSLAASRLFFPHQRRFFFLHLCFDLPFDDSLYLFRLFAGTSSCCCCCCLSVSEALKSSSMSALSDSFATRSFAFAFAFAIALIQPLSRFSNSNIPKILHQVRTEAAPEKKLETFISKQQQRRRRQAKLF